MVSVIIPCHNNRNTIDRAVRSVLSQTYQDTEVIIIDNGSRDRVYIENMALNLDKVRYVWFDKSLGASGARTEGIRLAKGEYIAFLDADDFWHKEKLEKQLKYLKSFRYHGEAPKLCFTGRRLVYRDEQGRLRKGRFVHAERVVDYRRLLRSNQINCSSVLMKKCQAERLIFPEGNIHEDYAAWLSLLKKGGYAAGIDEPLYYYMLSKGSRSGDKLRSAIMTYNVYRYEGIGIAESLIHMITYTLKGVRKYGIKTLKTLNR